MAEAFIDLSTLFTVNQPLAPSHDQTFILGGTVHEDIQLMEVNGERFGAPSQFLLRPIDSDWNKWSYEVSLASVRKFSVRAAVVGEEEGYFVSPTDFFAFTDSDVQLRANEPLGSGEFQLATDWLNASLLTPSEFACITGDLSISSISGEYSASGEWRAENFVPWATLQGWKQSKGPFGYYNGGIYPGANTQLRSSLTIPASTSNEYIQALIDAGQATGDRVWTHLFRKPFTLGEDFVSVDNLMLELSYVGAIEVFLNEVSIYQDGMRCGTGFPWGFTNYGTDHSTYAGSIAVSNELIQSGDNILTVALKASTSNEVDLYLSVGLKADVSRYQWSAPKDATIEFSTGTQTEVKNFNSLDEFGLLFDLPRLPAEYNVDYKNRLMGFVNADLRTNSTYRGLLNGISHQLGLPIDVNGLTVTAQDSLEQPGQKAVTNLDMYVTDGVLFFTASEFLKAGEVATKDINYARITTSEIISRILSLAEEDENVVPSNMYSVPEHGQWIEIDPSLIGRDLRVTYQYAETMPLSGSSLRDVVLFLNNIEVNGGPAVLAMLAEEFNPEVYESTGSVSNEMFVLDSINTTRYHLPNPLYLVMGDEERAVSSISNDHIFYEGDLLPNTASGDFTMTVSPPAAFFPTVRFTDPEEITVPLYQVRLEKVDKVMLQKWVNVYEDSTSDATELVRMIRDLMHIRWDEQVLDYDLWNAVESLLVSNSEIPSLYDMPKQGFRVGTSSEILSPEVYRAYGGVSNDHVFREELFASNDFQSGVGSVDEDHIPASPDDLKLVELVEVGDEWRPKITTGFFHIGDRTYYLYDQKTTKWIMDVAWFHIPLPAVTVLDGRTLYLPATGATVRWVPTGYDLESQHVQIRNNEVWINLAFLNPDLYPGYDASVFGQSVRISFSYEDRIDNDIVTQWSPSYDFIIALLDRSYHLDPLPTPGAPIVMTDVSGELLWTPEEKHPQFSVEDGKLIFLADPLSTANKLNSIIEWEAGSGDYHTSDQVDYNPVNNPDASGFLAIENCQRGPAPGEVLL